MSTAHMDMPHFRHLLPRISIWHAIALSVLLHALIAALLFGLIKAPEREAREPDHYTVSIVDPPADVTPLPQSPPTAEQRPGELRSRLRPGSSIIAPEARAPMAPSAPISPMPETVPPVIGIEPLAPETRSIPGFRLYDPAVIGDVAMSRTPSEPAVEKGGISFDTKELMYKGYMDLLRDKIQSIWVYPSEAAARKLYGDLYINFTIRKDGTLGAVKVVRTSGYSMLDEAALKALRAGQPYWPLPEAWDMEALTIKGHFIYALEGYYLK